MCACRLMLERSAHRPVGMLDNERYAAYSVWCERRILPSILVSHSSARFIPSDSGLWCYSTFPLWGVLYLCDYWHCSRSMQTRFCVTMRCPYVRPSVCSVVQLLHAAAASALLLWAWRAGDIDRLLYSRWCSSMVPQQLQAVLSCQLM